MIKNFSKSTTVCPPGAQCAVKFTWFWSAQRQFLLGTDPGCCCEINQ